MGSNLNFKNFGNEPPNNGAGDGVNRPPGNFPLARQTSIYSLTFDEFQSSLGKDFGSMNMDELLKSIWTAEETQAMTSTSWGGTGTGSAAAIAGGGAGLQRQGSLTLPRTLSHKTVDEVWRDFSKEFTGKDCMGGSSNVPQRQQTLGEMTLEDFLVRAGVVREETQVAGKVNAGGFFGNISNAGLGIGFQQDASRVSNLMSDRGQDASNLPLNMNGVRLGQQQQPILPKQPTFGYGTQQQQGNSQLGSPGIRNGVVGFGNNTGLVQNAAIQNAGYGLTGGFQVGVAGSSPVTPLSSDGIGKSNGEISSVSPVPYCFGGGLRGRRSSGAVEKVVERRQRRMIKNRESAARSRARKQAYTTELEAEVAKLKEENEELKRKQAEMLELQKNQATEIMNLQGGAKKRLRRTQTGPW